MLARMSIAAIAVGLNVVAAMSQEGSGSSSGEERADQHQQQEVIRPRETSAQPRGPQPPHIPARPVRFDPLSCTETPTRRDASLCAQWRAADAAKQSAKYAWWSVVSAALFALALVPAWWANWIAKNNGHKQLRAYLGCDEIELIAGGLNGPYVRMPVRNFGQTPAYSVTVRSQPIFDGEPITPNFHSHGFGIIDPGAAPPGIVELPDISLIDLKKEDKPHLKIKTEIYYQDIYQKYWIR
ncbi:hypothetical protein [Consotaella aegiceratis]|uniref:hypothetical protein n=1 Tax=Consotaella aegiceratis TaxID=3097961 RepID=UPI002F423348